MFSQNDLNYLDGETFDPTRDSLDGMETFDPKGSIVDMQRQSRGIFQAQNGKDGIITIRIRNTKNVKRRFELFNALKHITKIPNASQYANTNNYSPLSSGYLASLTGTLGIQSGSGATFPPYILPDFTLFNDATGSHVYVDGDVFGDQNVSALIRAELAAGRQINWDSFADVIVSCSQLPYKQLLDSFSSMVWRITKTKLQTSSENQIKNSFDFVYYSPFGGQENNSFEPSEFFLPSNQQTKVIDIPKQYEIDANTAIYVDLEPLEDMQITFFVNAFRNNAIKW